MMQHPIDSLHHLLARELTVKPQALPALLQLVLLNLASSLLQSAVKYNTIPRQYFPSGDILAIDQHTLQEGDGRLALGRSL